MTITLKSTLPIIPVLPHVLAALQNGSAILNAPTGSGKTTIVPLALLEEGWLSGRKIIMLEPRRIAARAASARMSELIGEPLGATVGYRIRFDSKISSRTRIEVVTEGVLTRRLQSDSELTDVGLIIFDEFHERSLQADLGLALCLDLCELRSDLHLLVMSATLDTEPLSRLMNGAPVICGEGKSYPVTVHFLPPSSPDTAIVQTMVRGIERAWQDEQGDILAFLPGAGEIYATGESLAGRFAATDILPLYGELSHAEQDLVLRPSHRQNRRIILATPIAETSITIEGIGCVVDSGLARRPRFNPATGLDRLETVRISRASAEQRRGRAGRLGPGRCYRLWSRETHQGLLPFTPPEIVQGDLASVVLDLALWGVSDPDQLKWLDPPRLGAWNSAKVLLVSLGALDKHGRITATGRKLAPLPIHPRLGAMLLAARKLRLGATACMVAALLSEHDIYKGRERSIDLRDRVQVLVDFRNHHNGAVDPVVCRRILKQIGQWRKLLDISTHEHIRTAACGVLLTFAYPDRLAVLRKGSRDRYQLVTGKGARLPGGDLLADTPLLVIPQLDAGREDARIFLAAPIDEDDLYVHHPGLFRTEDRIWWDTLSGRVQAVKETLLGRIVLSGTPLANPDQEQILSSFLTGIREIGADKLPWNHESRQLQARIGSLRHWQGEGWPDIGDNALIADLVWLAPYCVRMTSSAELKQLDMKTILQSLFSREQLLQLDKAAPTHITVPSGSRIKLAYEPGKSPVLAVRLQEMFGQSVTPTVCHGLIKVTLHLLSPSNRPIQVTSDLESFWLTTYAEVKKELAGRYPKHYWPDDPHQAQATARTKKAMQRAGSCGILKPQSKNK
jgi:ATP-dependent helicase HrpB